jgi:hypothetical protein
MFYVSKAQLIIYLKKESESKSRILNQNKIDVNDVLHSYSKKNLTN